MVAVRVLRELVQTLWLQSPSYFSPPSSSLLGLMFYYSDPFVPFPQPEQYYGPTTLNLYTYPFPLRVSALPPWWDLMFSTCVCLLIVALPPLRKWRVSQAPWGCGLLLFSTVCSISTTVPDSCSKRVLSDGEMNESELHENRGWVSLALIRSQAQCWKHSVHFC